MLSSSQNNIETLITKLLIDGRYKKAIEFGHQNYQIRQFKIDSLSPNEIIFSMYYCIKTKFYYSKPQASNNSWFQNELKLFIWLLVCYSYLQEKCISKMTNQDWIFFSRIFNYKNPDIFQFQAHSILKKKIKFAKWTTQQINLLDSIIKEKRKKNKWNQIAKELFIRSRKQFFRTAKQCREHWINHLDPVPVRSEWQVSQDYQLVKAVRITDKKWSKVSKMFHGTRTEHMAKNRFNSLYHFQLKRCKNEQQKSMKQVDIILEMEKRLAAMMQDNILNNPGCLIKNQTDYSQNEAKSELYSGEECILKGEDSLQIQQIEGQINDGEGDLRSEADEGFKFPTHHTLPNFGIVYDEQVSQRDNSELCNYKNEDFKSFFQEEFNY